MISTKVTVATTATLVLPAEDKNRTVYFHNPSGTKIYLGGSNVTTTTGFHLDSNSSQDFFVPTNEKMYGIVASSTHDIIVLTPDLD